MRMTGLCLPKKITMETLRRKEKQEMKDIDYDDLINYLQELIDQGWTPKVKKMKIVQTQSIIKRERNNQKHLLRSEIKTISK
jgi:predicted RNA-binding protein YlxR (DUF448 family)